MKHLISALFLSLLPALALADAPCPPALQAVAPQDYTAFGTTYPSATVSGDFQRYAFTGRENSTLAAAGAPMFYRNRMYSTALGRFGRRDPVGYVDEANVYTYVRDNPNIRTDPFGLASWTMDKSSCVLTMTYTIGISAWVGPEGYWTPAKKDDFLLSVKTGIEKVWNNSSFAIYPARASYTWCYAFTRCCSCYVKGWTPKVEVEVVDNKRAEADGYVNANANPEKRHQPYTAPTVRRVPGDFYEGGDQPFHIVPSTTQIPFAHEFGHSGAWLDHPGAGMKRPDGTHIYYSQDDAYSYPTLWGNARGAGPFREALDTQGFAVNGMIDLMGVGSGLRPFYYLRWAQQLAKENAACAPYTVKRVPNANSAPMLTPEQEKALAEQLRKTELLVQQVERWQRIRAELTTDESRQGEHNIFDGE